MVNISIDVTDLGGEARPGDKVVLWKPAAAGSATHAGRVISTAPVDVFLTNGKATVPDVEPGSMRVLLQCRGVESQGPIDVTVPDGNGTVTLRSLIESQFEYAPPIVSAVQEAASNASASEEAAIQAQIRSEAAADRADAKVDDAINNGANLVCDEVKQDADRAVSARQAAAQSESNAAASEGAAASSASNAVASESAAKQSETNAGDYAAVATTAATEAVDAMEESRGAADSIANSVSAAAGHADRAEQYESGAAAYAQNASDAADRVGTADQIEGWVQQAKDAADRIGTAEQVEGWVDDARNSASSASSSESKAKEYRDAAASAASTTADSIRSDLRGISSEASSYATDASRSAARAKASETNAATHEANSLSAAERAEFAAEETIQQVEGDFATRNYVDDLRESSDTYGGYQPATVDVDTLLAGGTNSNSRMYYRMGSGGNTPDALAGVLDVTNSGYQFTQVFYSSTNNTTFQRTITDRSHIVPDQWLFGEWQRQAIDDKTRMAAGEARRAAVVEAGLKRRGGVVGTGGKPAIALRFDHHLQQFGDKVLPLLKQYRLPWGQMINAGNIGSGNDTWSWSKLAKEAHYSGGEVWNHAFTHGDVNNEFQADQAVTLGLSRLRENLPSLWVDSWAPPGQPNYMGFTHQADPEKFYETYPGKLVLAQHAFVRGSYPGPHHPLNGQNLIGQSHVTIDKQTSAWCQAAVRSARDTGSGLTMMLHSNYLDQSGYMTTSELDAVLAYIAQLRDAGEIVVLSNAGILMADANTPARQTNMLSNAGAGTNTGTWSQSVTSRSYLAHLGVPHEAEVWVKGSGQATLKVEVASPTNAVTAQHQATLGGSAQRLSVLVTPPNNTTGITVSLTGDVQHTGIVYRPI